MEPQKQNTVITQPINIPKVVSLQQSFSNLNGKTNSISKRIMVMAILGRCILITMESSLSLI